MGNSISNKNFHKAKNAKNDEFYTLYEDIEKEIKHYDKDNFKDKIIYCNCDDYRFSNFVKFFKDNFSSLGLKGLIATNFNIGYGSFYYAYNGEKEVIKEIENGSFDSDFCLALLEKSDLVITNPPFSLFRKYIDLLISRDKKFLVIGNFGCVAYNEIFKLLKNGKLHLGASPRNMKFICDGKYKSVNAKFFTNISYKINRCYNKTSQDLTIFKKYHNCDAIDIPKSSMIPYNYNGVMGVPITYLENFDYDTFEIVGLGKGGMFDSTFKYDNPIMVSKNYKQYSSFNDYLMLFSEEKPEGTYYIADNVEGYLIQPYARLLIKRKEIP